MNADVDDLRDLVDVTAHFIQETDLRYLQIYVVARLSQTGAVCIGTMQAFERLLYDLIPNRLWEWLEDVYIRVNWKIVRQRNSNNTTIDLFSFHHSQFMSFFS